ncbi:MULTISPECIES: hypothetical protein [Bacillus]|nr:MULTISPECIES: hypothetical protein [Bacillus]
MPSIQDTIYPRIKNNLSDQDLEETYTPLQGHGKNSFFFEPLTR